MDINKEEIFEKLQNFDDKCADGKISEPLENYIKHIAKTGDILFPWLTVKPLLRKKCELVLDEFHEKNPVSAASTPPFNFEELKQEIIKTLDAFYGAPFTIQRICELLTLPDKHYKKTDKFMRGLEKNILVVSHVDQKNNERGSGPPTPKSIFAVDAGFGCDDYSSSSRSVDPFENPEPGTSSASNLASNKIILPSMNLRCPSSPPSPAPLQQLDSFTTVFSSPPSTPLAVVNNMAPFESASSSSSGSSSSGSSTGSSPQPLDDHSPEPKEEESQPASNSPQDEQMPSEEQPTEVANEGSQEQNGSDETVSVLEVTAEPTETPSETIVTETESTNVEMKSDPPEVPLTVESQPEQEVTSEEATTFQVTPLGSLPSIDV